MKSQVVFAGLFVVGLASAQDITSFLPMNNLLDVNPVACSWNIRAKEHLHGISALENW